MNISTASRLCIFALKLFAPSLLCVAFAQANTLGGQVPQIPAFLPKSSEVPLTERLPIDGEWTISSIGTGATIRRETFRHGTERTVA
jgi:hypothetical protein